MDIKFNDFEDNDRKRQLAEMTKADYWEVQADMWHQNYKEAVNEIERLREILRRAVEYKEALQTVADEGSGWGQSVAHAALKEGE